MNLKPVLVLDGERESALAIVRSLGRNGLRVEIGSSKTSPLAALSKYCSCHFIYPNPLVDVPGFRRALLGQLQQRSYSLVIPVTDLTICPLMGIRDSVEGLARLAMASNEALALALSKSRTYDLASTFGVPIPKTVIVRDVEELHGLQDRLTYPVVIKADRSKIWPSNGRGQDISVAYVFTPKELNARVSQLLVLGPVVLQEHIRGEGVGIGALAEAGETLFAFQYRRLHEVPLTGGASSYRVSEAVDPELISYASSLVKGLCWDGVAMIEFKMNREVCKAYLMEINGRFWGSLPLAVAAGADFPAYLFDLMVNQRREFPAAYKVGVRCRQLSREVEWLKEVLVRRRVANTKVQFPSYRRILLDSCRLLNPAEYSDTLDIRDPRPGIIDLFNILQKTAKDARNKIWCVRQERRMRRFRHNPRSLQRKLRHARTILIICHGNIIRSPFAAQFLAQSLKNKRSVFVYTAGLEAVNGLRAHPNAVSKAKSLGFDLGSHRSVRVTEDMLARADLVFGMEVSHLLLLCKRFPGARRKGFLLSCLCPETPLEISDPIQKDETEFTECFEQIIRALEPITLALCPNDSVRCISA